MNINRPYRSASARRPQPRRASLWPRLRRRVLGMSYDEVTFRRRGFRHGEAGLREHLEFIGKTFLDGYHHALEESDVERLAERLNRTNLEFRGFAYEGAAMGLALLDRLTPWNRTRLSDFLAGPGDAHAYVAHVAVGWILGKLGGNVRRVRTSLDPLLGWLAVEGYGFHEGFFQWPRYIHGEPVPSRLEGYEQNVFDQGLGRSLWFVEGGHVPAITQTISNFPQCRQGDLWSGLGLSCCYAGEVSEENLIQLQAGSGSFASHLAQGAAFAAKARHRGGNVTSYTELACQILGGVSSNEAARITDEALENLSSDDSEPAFEIWRRRIQFRLRSQPLVTS